LDKSRKLLQHHEGLKLELYRCTADKQTIGFGHNLTDRGISRAMAEIIFEADYDEAFASASTVVKNFRSLSSPRSSVLVNMSFQLGSGGLRSFKKFIAAVEAEDWGLASYEMLDSKWAQQTPARASTLATMMRTNKWPNVPGIREESYYG